jgi:hypothetical protein
MSIEMKKKIKNLGGQKLMLIPAIRVDQHTIECINCHKQRTVSYYIPPDDIPKFCNNKCRSELLIKLNASNPKCCVRCKERKEKQDFRRMASGQTYRNCKECEIKTQAVVHITQIVKETHGVSYSTYHKGLSAENFIKSIVILARGRAKWLKRDFNIDAEYIMALYEKQAGLCALSGIEMTHEVGKKHVPSNMSIDRIDSQYGYIKGNVQLVCYQINIMKQKLTVDELSFWCSKVVEIIGKK